MQQLLQGLALTRHHLYNESLSWAEGGFCTKRMTCMRRPGRGSPLSMMTRIFCIVWIFVSSLPFSRALRRALMSLVLSLPVSSRCTIVHAAEDAISSARVATGQELLSAEGGGGGGNGEDDRKERISVWEANTCRAPSQGRNLTRLPRQRRSRAVGFLEASPALANVSPHRDFVFIITMTAVKRLMTGTRFPYVYFL